MVGESLDPGVRIDTPPAGRGEDRVAVECQAGGVGQQMPDRGALGSRRLVQIDRPLLHGDQGGHPHQELGHRGDEGDPLGIAGQAQSAIGVRDANRGLLHRPVGDERGEVVDLSGQAVLTRETRHGARCWSRLARSAADRSRRRGARQQPRGSAQRRTD